MKKLAVVLLMVFVAVNLSAQEFSATLKDSTGSPIAFANIVVLNQADSSLITGAVSDTLGNFAVKVENPQDKMIIVSFIGFHRYTSPLNQLPKEIILQRNESLLQEVEVKAQRQMLRMERNKFIYDAEIVRQKKIVVSAFDLIRELPSVESEDENSFTLIGGGRPNILINGRVSKMEYSVLINYLKTLPAEKVKDVEISYEATGEYGVKGSAINVIVKRDKNYSISGQIGGSYRNNTVNGSSINGSAFFSSPKWDFDVAYNGGYYVNISRNEKIIKHHVQNTTEDNIYTINSDYFNISRAKAHYLYSSASYNINDKSLINISYVGENNPYHKAKMHSENDLLGDNRKITLYDKQMNDVSLYYKLGNILNAGIEYMHLNTNNNQDMQSGLHNGTLSDKFKHDINQKADRITGYINLRNQLPRNWSLSYGANYSYTKTNTTQEIDESSSASVNSYETATMIDEYNLFVFANIGKHFLQNKLYAEIGFSDSYLKNNEKTNTLLPRLTLSYVFSPNHILQAIFGTSQSYVSFWDMQDYTTYVNRYELYVGNPKLKNSTGENLVLYYTLKQKYIFVAAYSHNKNKIQSQQYLMPDTLLMVSKTLNFDNYHNLYLNTQIPVNFSKRISSRFHGSFYFERMDVDDWFGKRISKNSTSFFVSDATDITLSFKPRIIFSVNLRYNSPSYSMMTKIHEHYSVSLSLRGNFFENRLFVSIHLSDIFESNAAKTSFDWFGQYYETNPNFYGRTLFVQASYSFKGYKRRQQKSVDTSRFLN